MVSVAMLAAGTAWEVGMMEWLLTYAVHSTVLIGAIWALTTFVPKIPLSIKESLWKLALLGGLFTASVQTAVGVGSPWGQLDMPRALAGERAASSDPIATAPDSDPAVERHRVVVHQNGDLRIRATRVHPAVATPAAIAAPSQPPAAPGPWRWVLLGLVAAGSMFASIRLWMAARRLKAQLAARRDVIEDPVLEAFLSLCHKAELKKRPRLTASPHLRSPIALPSHEICLPERAVDSLTPAQQEGMLAHELAHLLRRDPLWQVLAAMIEAVFFFQPLNHLARRKMQEVAEYQCDDWAAQNTGSGVHLAKCLAEVAGWVEAGPPSSPVATPMAHENSPIVRRITRLLHEGKKRGATHPIGRVGVIVGTLGLATWLIPGVVQAEAAPASPGGDGSPTLASAQAVAIAFEDIPSGDHERSRVRVGTGEDAIELEVDHPRSEAPRLEPPLPPVPPERPRRGSGMRIIIGGHGGCCGDPLGLFGGHFHGFFRMEIDDEMLDELFAPGFPFDDDIGDLERELHEEIFGRPPPPHHDPGYPQWHGDPTERVDTPAPPPAQYQLLRGEAPSDGADVVEL